MTRFPSLAFLDKYKEYGPIFIRLIIGFHLIYGVQDNIFSSERMHEFAEFMRVRGVPFPLFSAFLSVYAQFICGILFILGALTRYAAVVMVINFIAAILIAHRADPYPRMFPALMMLFAALFFLIHGAGKLSIDDLLERRGRQSDAP